MTPLHHHSGANPPTTPWRRSGREGPHELTAAFRRYVDRVQDVEDRTPCTDLAAALQLAEDVTGDDAAGPVAAAAVAEYGPAIRQLARAVRQAGGRAVAHPALLARAIVLARSIAQAPTASRTGAQQRSLAVTRR
jgi:hypothetical protein